MQRSMEEPDLVRGTHFYEDLPIGVNGETCAPRPNVVQITRITGRNHAVQLPVIGAAAPISFRVLTVLVVHGESIAS